MLFAKSEDGIRILAAKGLKGSCEECRSVLVPKCGRIVTPHWAHKSRIDCDGWSEPETNWHREWKLRFRQEEVEVTIKRDGCHHRADVHLKNPAADGIDTIEFQHSPLSVDDIWCRERFYGRDRLLWVIDAQTAYSDNRLNFEPIHRSKGEQIHRADWKRGRKSLVECMAPLALDLGKYKDKPTATHLILRVTYIGTYPYEANTPWGYQEGERMEVSGYFQNKDQFLHFYTKSRN